MPGQEDQLLLGLYAFGDGFHVERPGHRDDGARDRRGIDAAAQVEGEGLIDLDYVDWGSA